MIIGISKVILENEIKTVQQKSLDDVIEDIKASGVEVTIFEQKDRNYMINLTGGQIYETEIALRNFYNDLKLHKIDIEKKYSRPIAFFLGIFPLTGVMGVQAFYAGVKALKIFHIIADIILAILLFLLLIVPSCSSSCAVTVGSVYIIFIICWAIVLYTFSWLESLWLLLHKKSNSKKSNSRDVFIFICATIVAIIASMAIFIRR